MSGSPGSYPVILHITISKRIEGDIGIFYHLEVIHARTNKVSAFLKSIFKSLSRVNGSCCHRFEGNPGLRKTFHVFNRFLYIEAIFVIMPFLMFGRPIIVMMQCLHPEIRFKTCFYACLNRSRF